jgi:hypothetical protein
MSESKEFKAKQPAMRAKAADSAAEAIPSAEPAAVAHPVTPFAARPPPAPQRTQSAADDMFAACCGTMAGIGESQRAVVSGIKALALAMSDLAHANLTVAGDSATAMVGARNFTAAVEIQLGFARRSFDSLLAGSARLSEIGVRLTREASRPIVAPLAGPNRVE